jgi:GTPase
LLYRFIVSTFLLLEVAKQRVVRQQKLDISRYAAGEAGLASRHLPRDTTVVIEHGVQHDRAYLIGVQAPEESAAHATQMLDELAALCRTIGLTICGQQIATVREVAPRYYLGSGKAEEIAQAADEREADVIVFDHDLAPSQQRNWESLSNRSVTDRQGIILEIFADRAQTREAQLQVELARMEYSLPRLTSAWSHLSRQRGGRRGTRGEGETQLEVDRRVVQQRIAGLKRDLRGVQSQRDTLRHQRSELPVPMGAIVGYTNAGKSSLLKRLTGSEVLIADKLFATLDPATRRFELPGGQEVVLTDTVGFIQRLPHGLVDAFKSTLEETRVASFLLHVIDGADPAAAIHARITMEVLREIGAADKPMITVINKEDLLTSQSREALGFAFPEALRVSAERGTGISELLEEIRTCVARQYRRILVELPHSRYDLAALIHRTGRILEEKHGDTAVSIRADVPARTEKLLNEYRTA